jgi:dTDP-4-amino-4,6-dideoxygalactose transaminase
LDEIQAAFLNVKLRYIDAENEYRKKVAKYYCDNIKHPDIILPKLTDSHVWHLFVIRHIDRKELQKYLADNGVQTSIHYPIPPHKQPCYNEYALMSLPITEKIHDEVLSFPISPIINIEEQEFIIKLINAQLGNINSVK